LAINRLLNYLDDERWFVRGAACDVLGLIGPYLKDLTTLVFTSLVRGLAAPQTVIVRAKLLQALGNVPSADMLNPETVDTIIECLRPDQEWYLRTMACEALGNKLPLLPAAAPRLTDALIACLDAREWCVRAGACGALGRLGDHQRNAKELQGLIARLCDPQESVRMQASEALAHLIHSGEHPVRLIPVPEGQYFLAQGRRSSFQIPFPKELPDYLQVQVRITPSQKKVPVDDGTHELRL
jgi:HEAT repeat protein